MATTTNLERYRPISSLGVGGMSSVSLAEDTVLSRRVALKRMHATGDDRRLSRLRREALIGASVSHPNLVPIYDIVTLDDGDQVIVMEYVEGETLRDAVRRDGGLGPAEALRVLDGVAAALDAIHEQGIVHRDVKPANILLGADGTTKLADLGVASAPDRTQITTEGGVVGTFSYMAPEQLGGATATAAADIYAFAAVAFEALSGRKAHTEGNPLALAHAIATQPPPDVRGAWPKAPAAAAQILMRGMAPEPGDRPRSAGELVGRLRAALTPEATQSAPAAAPASPPPPAPAEHRRGAWVVVSAVIVLIAAAVGLAVLLSGSGSKKAGSTAASRTSPHSTRTRARTATHVTSPPTHTSSTPASTASTPATGTPTTPAAPASATPPAGPGAKPGAGGPASGTGSPVSAVERFYELAAAHQYRSAWALADPSFQEQLGGYQGFESTMSQERSITFDSARTVSQSPQAAAVAVQTTSARSNGTQHCSGTVQLVPGAGGAWLLHQIAISCS